MPQKVVVDGKLNSELLLLIETHPIMVRNTLNPPQIVSLLNQAVKLFGNDLMYAPSRNNTQFFFSLEILQGGLSEKSIYLGPKKGLFFNVNLGNYYGDEVDGATVGLFLHSVAGQEVIHTLSKKNNHVTHPRGTIRWARKVLGAYHKRLTRYTQKHELNKEEAFIFVNALELYSEYATRHKAQLNVANYLARAVKGGMTAEKAVWMVYNKHSVELAADYKHIPTTWVLRI